MEYVVPQLPAESGFVQGTPNHHHDARTVDFDMCRIGNKKQALISTPFLHSNV